MGTKKILFFILSVAIIDVPSDVFDDLFEPPVAPLGVISVTLLGLLLTSRHSVSKLTNVNKHQQLHHCILLLPLIIILTPILITLACYRWAASCFLRHALAPNFVELMEGPDAIWNLNDISRPIINILAEVESPGGANVLLQDMKGALQRILKICPKLSWTRQTSALGFSYWERRSDPFPIEHHVRWLPEDTLGAGGKISMPALQVLVSNISSAPLPDNDSSCWEILVGSSKIDDQKYSGKEVFPILIRIHHSVGDGVSLMELLLKGLSSNCNTEKELKGFHSPEKILPAHMTQNSDETYIQLGTDIQDCCTNTHGQKQTKKHNNFSFSFLEYKIPFMTLKKLSFAFKYVMNFFHNSYALLRVALSLSVSDTDTSILDGKELTGEKILACYRDDEDESLFTLIKKIKAQKTGTRFTEVLLAALSEALSKYFKEKSENVPSHVSVVIPVYVKHLFGKNKKMSLAEDGENEQCLEEKSIDLNNCFTLGILKLPIKMRDRVPLQTRLQNVSQNMTYLNNSGQFLLNVFLLRWMAALLPRNLLEIFVKSAGQATLVASNLIGPANTLLIAEHPLKSLLFWVPNRGSTGVGVSILSYDNRLHLGLNMDRALVNASEEVQQLLNRTVLELQNMNYEITKNSYPLL